MTEAFNQNPIAISLIVALGAGWILLYIRVLVGNPPGSDEGPDPRREGE